MSDDVSKSISELIAFAEKRDLEQQERNRLVEEKAAQQKAEEEAKAQRQIQTRHTRTLEATRTGNSTWVAGVSANPGARGKAIKARQISFSKAAYEATDGMQEYLTFLLAVGRDEVPGATLKERLEAWKEIANRSMGKAPDLVLHADVSDTPFAQLSVEELKRLAAGEDDDSGEE